VAHECGSRILPQGQSGTHGGSARQTVRVAPEAMNDLRRDWPQQNWDALLSTAAKRQMAGGGLQKRFKQRMVAAKMAIGLTHDELFGQPVRLPQSQTGLSTDQLAKLVRRETAIDDSENVEKLVWRKSRPIIHLAIAIQLLLAASGATEASVSLRYTGCPFFSAGGFPGRHSGANGPRPSAVQYHT
jgi:hypothetical protein